jgi:hypothetical protein
MVGSGWNAKGVNDLKTKAVAQVTLNLEGEIGHETLGSEQYFEKGRKDEATSRPYMPVIAQRRSRNSESSLTAAR